MEEQSEKEVLYEWGKDFIRRIEIYSERRQARIPFISGFGKVLAEHLKRREQRRKPKHL